MEELDKKYPNRIEKRKQYWYQYLTQKFKPTEVPLTIVWATKDNILILSFD